MKHTSKLHYLHPNARGTGCAIEFALHPAHGDVEGSIFVTMKNQTTLGDRSVEPPVFPAFDTDHPIHFKLCLDDLTHILAVLRGHHESISDGKGLFHRSTTHKTIIRFRHIIDDHFGSCYDLEAMRTEIATDKITAAHILFTECEALGLLLVIEQSLHAIAFGYPENI